MKNVPDMIIMLTSISYVLTTILTFACADVIYPTKYGKQQLVTQLHCQEDETQNFHYSSTTSLWGNVGGDIILTADVTIHCLGDDKGGKYEDEAIKYLAEVTNLKINQKSTTSHEELLKRRRRGIGDFFSNAWTKIKNFFSGLFGGGNSEPEPTVNYEPPSHSVTADDRKEESEVELEAEEDFPESTVEDLRPLYSVPFQFLQLANGSIPEIRFAENEVEDGTIRNFKRHLVDGFATQLNFKQRSKDVVETSVTGEHVSSYNVEISGDGTPMNLAGFNIPQQDEQTVTVKKLVTGDKIRRLADSEALNDRDKMELSLQQMQIYKGGKLLESSGKSSLVLLSETDSRKGRIKREDKEDITSKFHAHSTFSLKLQRRRRRSSEDSARIELSENLTFFPASRLAEKEDGAERQKLRNLQKSTGDMTHLFQSLLDNQDEDYDEKMQIISEMVHREVDLKLDNEKNSASNIVRNALTQEMLLQLCDKNFTVCKDFLQLLAVAGGPKAESVILAFLSNQSILTPLQTRLVAGTITDLSNPSSTFLSSLVQLISDKKRDPEILGSICLGSGSLGSKADRKIKEKISKAFTELLEKHRNGCEKDEFLLDVLEAVGNLDCRMTVSAVLEVSKCCSHNSSIQIACAHALRHHSDLPSVKLWIENMTVNGDCEVTRAIVGALMDKIQDQQTVGDTSNWPRNGFNQVDENLKELLLKPGCAIEDTILYFAKKKNRMANEIAWNYYEPESEPWISGTNYRQKRGLWDNLNCQEWTEDSKFKPIQDKEEFASDRAMYNKRKSCLAFRRLGIKGANAEIYAGMFAGVKEPSEPPKYKLFTKFVSSINFLDHQMEIGSFYFYHNTGNTKAYVRILGQTRQEFTHEGCTPTDLKYRPIKHIPLYMVTVSVVHLSLGIHLSSQLSLNTECPSGHVYQMEPMTTVRIGGEALGTVALVRGGISLGGNFNYKLQFTFTPTPNMCVKGSHGYDPMSISFQTYYQLYNAAKFKWGKHRVWKPNFLSWDVTRGDLKSWFDDTCIRTDNRTINLDREIE